jgi:hypothetical protein
MPVERATRDRWCALRREVVSIIVFLVGLTFCARSLLLTGPRGAAWLAVVGAGALLLAAGAYHWATSLPRQAICFAATVLLYLAARAMRPPT